MDRWYQNQEGQLRQIVKLHELCHKKADFVAFINNFIVVKQSVQHQSPLIQTDFQWCLQTRYTNRLVVPPPSLGIEASRNRFMGSAMVYFYL